MTRKKITRREWLALLVCAVLIAGIFATGILNRQKVWANIALEGDCSLSLEQGDTYGTFGGGPYYDLPAGEYLLRWRIDSDGENVIRFSSSNDAEITPSQVRTNPDYWEDEVVLTLKDAVHNFSIFVDFSDGTRIQLDDLRLYSPEYTDGAWGAAFVLLGMWLLLVIWRRIPDEEGRRIFALLAVAVTFTSLPVLRENLIKTYDTQFHTARLMNLADGLRSGQLPVRIGGYSYNGYGAVTSAFYPDRLLYPLALMVLAGASITFVMQVLVVAVNMTTAATMYAAARRILGSRQAGVCAAILYVCSCDRLKTCYFAFMVGQMQGMAVLPLFILGLWEVCWGDKRRWPLLVVGATLVFQTHMLMTLMCVLLATGAVAVRLRAMLAERRFGVLIKAMVITLLLNVWSIVPMATLYSSGVTTMPVQHGFASYALEPYEVLLHRGAVDVALLIGVALFVSMNRPGQEEETAWRTAWVCTIGGAIAALISTRLFPWGHIVTLFPMMFETFQYPERFLILYSVLLALSGGFGFAHVLREKGQLTAAVVLGLSLLCVSPYLIDVIDNTDLMEFGQGPSPYIITPEYQIEGTDAADTRSRAVMMSGDMELLDYDKQGTRVSGTVSAREDSVLELPLFGFDGYAAEVDGRRMEIGLGSNNRLAVYLPAGTSGALRVFYEGKVIWRVFDAISLATLLVWLAVAARRRAQKKRRCAAAGAPLSGERKDG